MRRSIDGALDALRHRLSAVFVSGGGNDFAGFNDLRPLLGLDCSACTSEAACFNHGAAPGSVEALFDAREAALHRAHRPRARAHVPAAARIFVHNYDYALPSGKAVIGTRAWLKPALVAAKVPPRLRAGCVRYLIDQFSLRLADLVTLYGGRVVFVDSRGTLGPADWANELHPKASGFGKIARAAVEAGARRRPASCNRDVPRSCRGTSARQIDCFDAAALGEHAIGVRARLVVERAVVELQARRHRCRRGGWSP